MNFYYFKIYAVFLPPTRRLIVEEGSGKKRMEETTTIFLPVLRERARFFNLRLPTTDLLEPSHVGRVLAFPFRSRGDQSYFPSPFVTMYVTGTN